MNLEFTTKFSLNLAKLRELDKERSMLPERPLSRTLHMKTANITCHSSQSLQKPVTWGG